MNPDITKLANSHARKKGYGRATTITFEDVEGPTVRSANCGGYVKTSDGTPVSRAYARKGWSSCHYQPAACHIAIPLRYMLLPTT